MPRRSPDRIKNGQRQHLQRADGCRREPGHVEVGCGQRVGRRGGGGALGNLAHSRQGQDRRAVDQFGQRGMFVVVVIIDDFVPITSGDGPRVVLTGEQVIDLIIVYGQPLDRSQPQRERDGGHEQN